MCICVTVISHKSAFCGTAISHKSLSIHAACGGMYRKGKRGFSGDTPAPPSRGRSPLHPRPTAKSGLGSLLCPVRGPQSLASPLYGKGRSPPLPMPRRGATVPCIPALRQRAVSDASHAPSRSNGPLHPRSTAKGGLGSLSPPGHRATAFGLSAPHTGSPALWK